VRLPTWQRPSPRRCRLSIGVLPLGTSAGSVSRAVPGPLEARCASLGPPRWIEQDAQQDRYGISPGVRFPFGVFARAIVELVCLSSSVRSQGFSPSQRFDPAQALWLCFAPHPPIGFLTFRAFPTWVAAHLSVPLPSCGWVSLHAPGFPQGPLWPSSSHASDSAASRLEQPPSSSPTPPQISPRHQLHPYEASSIRTKRAAVTTPEALERAPSWVPPNPTHC
jgi:hypothetical protein